MNSIVQIFYLNLNYLCLMSSDMTSDEVPYNIHHTRVEKHHTIGAVMSSAGCRWHPTHQCVKTPLSVWWCRLICRLLSADDILHTECGKTALSVRWCRLICRLLGADDILHTECGKTPLSVRWCRLICRLLGSDDILHTSVVKHWSQCGNVVWKCRLAKLRFFEWSYSKILTNINLFLAATIMVW